MPTSEAPTNPPDDRRSARAEVNRNIASGAAWMISTRLCVTGLGLVSMLVLARLLQPSDFGLVALATALAAAFDLLTSFRFDVPLIQNQATTREDYDTAWTLNLSLGGVLALLLCGAALPAAAFFDEPRLTGVVLVLAATALLDGAQNIGIVNFRKEFAFPREFAFTASRKFASFVVGVSSAWYFRSYWALAAGIAASSIWGLIASYAMHPYRPRISMRAAHRLLAFSKWLVLDNVLQFLRYRSSDFLIGKLAGTGSLGLFNLASEVATLAQSTITAPINRALLPGYAHLSADIHALRETYLSVIAVTTLTAVPAAAGIAAIAPLLVPLALGDHWLAAIPLIRLLGIASAISLTGTGAAMAYLALGRPMLVVVLGVSYVVLLLGSMLFLLPRFGPTGAAWAVVVASVTNVPLQLLLVRRVLGPMLLSWASVVWRPLTGTTLMYLVVATYVNRSIASSGALVTETIASICLGVACYVASVIVLWLVAGRPAGAERRAVGAVQPWLRQRISGVRSGPSSR